MSSRIDRLGTRDVSCQPRFTESGERPRIDRSHALAQNDKADSSAPPTVPDALLFLDESEAAAADPEPAPESRRTSLGPFRYLQDADEPREQAPATRRR